MAEIIIIRGKQQSGKTTTAGLVYQELVKICDKTHKFNNHEVDKDSLQYNTQNATIDFKAVLRIENKNIGIISAGDRANDVREGILLLLSINVDIIICCARSRNVKGSAYRVIKEEFSKDNNILFEILTKYSPNQTDKINIKKDIVDKIMTKVKEFCRK